MARNPHVAALLCATPAATTVAGRLPIAVPGCPPTSVWWLIAIADRGYIRIGSTGR